MDCNNGFVKIYKVATGCCVPEAPQITIRNQDCNVHYLYCSAVALEKESGNAMDFLFYDELKPKILQDTYDTFAPGTDTLLSHGDKL